MKKLWFCILTIICLCVSVAFVACGNATYTVTVEVDNAEYGSVNVVKVENVAKDTAIIVDGATVTVGETKIAATPSRNTAQYSYSFDKWVAAETVTDDITITACFKRTINKYIVKFVSDGEVLQENELEYGAMPEYKGETPEKAATAQYTYTFDKWDKDTSVVTGDQTYTAIFTHAVNAYTVTWQDAQGVLSDKVETADYGTTPTFPWQYFEKVGDGTYIYNISVQKSTDGGETWGIASSHIGDYGESAMQPWGMDLNEFNAGLSAVTGDTIYKVTYNNVNPVSVVSGGEDFAVVQDGNVFTFTNVVADGSTVNRFMIHSDLLRYYFNADKTFLTVKVECAAGQSANFAVNTYWGYDTSGGVVKTASGTDRVEVPIYNVVSKAVSERHYWVDVVATNISDCDRFVVIIDFADTMYIKDAAELSAFAALSNAEYSTGNYKLANDIDLGSETIVAPFDNSGNRYSIGFAGTFDGQGYTIKGGEYGQAGLFGNILSGAVVKNIIFENAAWKGETNDNALLAWTVSGTLENITLKAVYNSEKTARTRLFTLYEINAATISDMDIFIRNDKVGTNVYPVAFWNKSEGVLDNVTVSADRILGASVLTNVGAGENLSGVSYANGFYLVKQDINGNIDIITEEIPGGKEGSAVKLTRSAGASGWATRFTLCPSFTTDIDSNKELMTDKYFVFDFYYTASSGAVFRPNNNYLSFDITVSCDLGYVWIFDEDGEVAYKITDNKWYTLVFDGNMLYGDRASGTVGNMYFNLGDTVGGGNIANFDFANNAAYFMNMRIIDEEELYASGLGWKLNENNFQKNSATNSAIATITEDLPDGREGEAVKLTRNIGASAWADGRFTITPATSVADGKKLLAGKYLIFDLYYTADAGMVFRPNNNYVNFDATKALNSSYVKAYDESGNEVEKITANKWYTLVFDGNMLYGDRTSGSIGNMILTLGDIGNGGNISTDANYYNGLAAYFMNMRVVSENPFVN